MGEGHSSSSGNRVNADKINKKNKTKKKQQIGVSSFERSSGVLTGDS